MIKHIEIKNADNRTLRGYLTYPEEFGGLLVIFYHGFTGNKTEHGCLFRDLSRLLEQNQIASLRMDFSGNGESDGSFSDFTFDTLISDAGLILDYGKKIEGVERIALLGFSMGGAVAAHIAAERSKDIEKVLLWSPSGNILGLIRNIYDKYPKLANGNADFPNFEISKAMIESLDNYKMYDNLNRFTKKVFIIHGKNDMSVNFQFGIQYRESFPNSEIHFIETAGHGYDKREEKQELFKYSLEFLKG